MVEKTVILLVTLFTLIFPGQNPAVEASSADKESITEEISDGISVEYFTDGDGTQIGIYAVGLCDTERIVIAMHKWNYLPFSRSIQLDIKGGNRLRADTAEEQLKITILEQNLIRIRNDLIEELSTQGVLAGRAGKIKEAVNLVCEVLNGYAI